MNANRKRFLMGKTVQVTRQFVRVLLYDHIKERSTVEWGSLPLSNPKTGWVVGFTTRHEGYYRQATLTDDFGSHRGPEFLHRTGTVPVMLVAFSPSGKPKEVPIDVGWELAEITAGRPSDKTLRRYKNQSEDSKEWPRDVKGRFLKLDIAFNAAVAPALEAVNDISRVETQNELPSLEPKPPKKPNSLFGV